MRLKRTAVAVMTTAGILAGTTVSPAASNAQVEPARAANVTIKDLKEMFPHHVGDVGTVARGLPQLNKQMRRADITSPRRKAAFLTTIAYESSFLYNAHAAGDTRRYAGRGYIQLTGSYNYQTAGDYLGVNLRKHPHKAKWKKWSAKIATWYWTVARDINPMADNLHMGQVNAAIGYPPGIHDKLRCKAFKDALRYYLASVPKGVKCKRPAAKSEIKPVSATTAIRNTEFL